MYAGPAVLKLIKSFIESRFWKVKNFYSSQRHWANIDTMITGSISEGNPFVIDLGWGKVRKCNSLEELKSSCKIDIEEILKGLPITFRKVKINHPSEAKPWWILVYNSGVWKGVRKEFLTYWDSR